MKLLKKSIAAITLTAALTSQAMAFGGEDQGSFQDFGDYAQLGVPIAAGAYALYLGDYEGLGQLAEGALYTAALTHIGKVAFDETRPNGGSGSFPSGHTSAAMQGAAFLSMRYGWEVGLPATVVAAAVGYSRVDGDYHYWRDVAAGTALAWGTQYVITEMGFSPTGFMLAPLIGNGSYGIQGSFEW